VRWHPADALPFPLCLAEFPDPADPGKRVAAAVAHGNVALADHGRRVGENEAPGRLFQRPCPPGRPIDLGSMQPA